MPNYSGVWNLVQQLQAVAAGNWPDPNLPIGLFGGGSSTGVNYVNLETTGNGTSFGSLISAGSGQGTASSKSRAVFCGSGNVIQYTTFATTGTFDDFGDLTLARNYAAGMSSSTRGVFAGGQPSSLTNVMDYITIATAGNAADFGDTTTDTGYAGGCASSTRGVFGGGLSGAGFSYTNVIEYITIASTGNSTDFGDLSFSQSWPTASCSNSTRGLFAGGFNNANGTTSINNIDYITIASVGNATDFGDLSSTRAAMGAAASLTRGFFAGGTSNGSTNVNIIEYVTIASAGNATDYADLTATVVYLSGCSNAHGGL